MGSNILREFRTFPSVDVSTIIGLYYPSIDPLYPSASTLKLLFGSSLLLSHLFVFARLFTNRKSKAFSASDIFLLASLASFFTYSTFGIFGIYHGIGSSSAEVSDGPTLSLGLKFLFLSELTSILTLLILRIAASLYYYSLTNRSSQRWVLLSFTILTTTFSIFYFILVLFQCRPIQYYWTSWLGEEGICIDNELMAYGGYAFAKESAAADWFLAGFWIWLYWGGKVARKAAVWRYGLMILGVCAGAAPLMRIPATRKLMATDDFFSDCVPIVVGSILEPALAMIALAAASFGHWNSSQVALAEPPLPLLLARADEKRALMTSSYRDEATLTGEQILSRQSSFRKVSPDRVLEIKIQEEMS